MWKPEGWARVRPHTRRRQHHHHHHLSLLLSEGFSTVSIVANKMRRYSFVIIVCFLIHFILFLSILVMSNNTLFILLCVVCTLCIILVVYIPTSIFQTLKTLYGHSIFSNALCRDLSVCVTLDLHLYSLSYLIQQYTLIPHLQSLFPANVFSNIFYRIYRIIWCKWILTFLHSLDYLPTFYIQFVYHLHIFIFLTE